MFDFEFPLAALFTHRHGVGVAVLKNQNFFESFENTSRFEMFQLIKKAQPVAFLDSWELLRFENFLFSRCRGKTAENLQVGFSKLLQECSLQTSHIKTFVVGVGPGSFTGLRLGCAFVNGVALAGRLALGKRTPVLIPVTTFCAPTLLTLCRSMDCEQECFAQLGTLSPDDPSVGFVTFFDILTGLIAVIQENWPKHLCSLSPEYGKEPTPVLKLKEGMRHES